MDTEGFFDADSTWEDCAKIFAFSNLLSSVHVFNLVRNLQLDFLKQVEIFGTYGGYARRSSQEKPFQDLIYLIRDWPSKKQHSYGIDGGRKYLCRFTKDGSTEIQEICKSIENAFQTTSCFLMPHPGLEVAETFEPSDNIEIRDEFLKQVNTFIKYLLSEDNLTVKKIGGREITCQDLPKVLTEYTELFEKSNVPAPNELFKFIGDVSFENVIRECNDFYNRKMNEFFTARGLQNGSADLEQLYNLHSKLFDESIAAAKLERLYNSVKPDVLERFKTMVEGKSSEASQTFLEELKKNIENDFDKMKGCIEESTRNLEKVVKVLDESQQRYVEEIEMELIECGLRSELADLGQLYDMHQKAKKKDFIEIKNLHSEKKIVVEKNFDDRVREIARGSTAAWIAELSERIESNYSKIETNLRRNRLQLLKILDVLERCETELKTKFQQFIDSKRWNNISVNDLREEYNRLCEKTLKSFKDDLKKIAKGSPEKWTTYMKGRLTKVCEGATEGARKVKKRRQYRLLKLTGATACGAVGVGLLFVPFSPVIVAAGIAAFAGETGLVASAFRDRKKA
ncbi:unnamed protein product [Enterobius vermicularis]|uniref:GB1/RHD3-type G domain-containing protein n=1 Tax=Enterobius vermicularis TaxID=51028 RepID=A0A0N4VET0_ENTVE|nr:unnamed protein product [Enterobius vermicularis]